MGKRAATVHATVVALEQRGSELAGGGAGAGDVALVWVPRPGVELAGGEGGGVVARVRAPRRGMTSQAVMVVWMFRCRNGPLGKGGGLQQLAQTKVVQGEQLALLCGGWNNRDAAVQAGELGLLGEVGPSSGVGVAENLLLDFLSFQ